MVTERNTEGKVDKANLLLIRDSFTDKSVIGKLYLNAEFYGHTLELAWKENQKESHAYLKECMKLQKDILKKANTNMSIYIF